jgi:predicted nucleic acid-binding protein
MILVDTSIIVAWLDPDHPQHQSCARALDGCAAVDELAISAVTFGELAAGGRSREALEEDLRGFARLDLSFEAAYRAGQAFGRHRAGKHESQPVLPDFLIHGQASALGLPHLTNDRRRLRAFPEVDFFLPSETE